MGLIAALGCATAQPKHEDKLGFPIFGPTTGGSGAVSSVSAGSGCVTVSPTTGAVVVTSSGCLANSGGSVALTNIAPETNQTILCNVSGGASSPIACTAAQINTMLGTNPYTFSTGLTNTSGTITENLAVGKSGGQTVFGDTLTTGNLTLRPNAADTTTGSVIVTGIGLQLPSTGTAAAVALNFGTPGTGIRGGASAMQISFGGADTVDIRATGIQLLNNSAGYYLGSGGQAGLTLNGTTGLNFFSGNATRGSITSTGNFLFGGSVATTATDGDVYIPSCAGPPTGVPSQAGNLIPLRADRTNNKVYAYMGAAWVALN